MIFLKFCLTLENTSENIARLFLLELLSNILPKTVNGDCQAVSIRFSRLLWEM